MGICNIVANGHLGRDAELKYTAQGEPVARFTLAVSHQEKDGKSTTWFDCSFWGKRAEKLAQWLTKGKAVVVAGAFKVREWEKDGRKGKSAEIRVNDLEFGAQGKGQDSEPGHNQPTPESVAQRDGEEILF